MSLGRIVFTKKKLSRKFGVVGKVAGRYVEAGFTVHVGFKTAEGEVSFIAKRGGQVYAVDVVNGSVDVGPATVEAIARKAASIKARPVLVLYGSGPRLTDDAKKKAEELGVLIRRVR